MGNNKEDGGKLHDELLINILPKGSCVRFQRGVARLETMGDDL